MYFTGCPIVRNRAVFPLILMVGGIRYIIGLKQYSIKYRVNLRVYENMCKIGVYFIEFTLLKIGVSLGYYDVSGLD